ncbi:MAG: TIGR03668 family PPOX class F420-dependent oxidoreductase, partial [Candidatus Dormibacteraceae bacterium]
MRRRVEAAAVARLGTLGDGQVHLVPITFAIEGDSLYFAVDRKPKRTPDLRRLRNIAAHPAVAVLVDSYDDDWSRLWWVRLDGVAEVLPESEEGGRALTLLQERYPQYRDEPPPGPVVAIRIRRWT